MRIQLLLIGCCFAALTHAQKPLRVFVFVAEQCPICISMTNALSMVAANFSDSADFTLAFPVSTSTTKTAAAFKTKYKLSAFSTQIDKQQILAQKLGARVTPEVVVLNRQDSVLYRGRINDSYLEPGKKRHIYSNNDLASALALANAGEPVPKPWKPAVGCYITFTKNKVD